MKKLRLVWSWGMNDKRTESQPLVHDGVMFLNQSSSILQALDATNGDLFWSYERKLPPKLPTLAYGNRDAQDGGYFRRFVRLGLRGPHVWSADHRSR